MHLTVFKSVRIWSPFVIRHDAQWAPVFLTIYTWDSSGSLGFLSTCSLGFLRTWRVRQNVDPQCVGAHFAWTAVSAQYVRWARSAVRICSHPTDTSHVCSCGTAFLVHRSFAVASPSVSAGACCRSNWRCCASWAAPWFHVGWNNAYHELDAFDPAMLVDPVEVDVAFEQSPQAHDRMGSSSRAATSYSADRPATATASIRSRDRRLRGAPRRWYSSTCRPAVYAPTHACWDM